MGSFCTRDCHPIDNDMAHSDSLTLVGTRRTKIAHPEWAEAVLNAHIAGIQMLHSNDESLVNAHVDEFATRAIHVAVQQKHHVLLKYLLRSGVDVNAKGGPHGNTALHECALIQNGVALRLLFAYRADGQLTNAHRKLPIDLCSDRRFQPLFANAQHSDCQVWQELRDRDETETDHEASLQLDDQLSSSSSSSSSAILVSGERVRVREHDESPETRRGSMRSRQSIASSRHSQQCSVSDMNIVIYEQRKLEIETRIAPISNFGRNVGVDIDEIAAIFQDMTKKVQLWNSCIGERKNIDTEREVCSIMMRVCWWALKKKYGVSVRKPDAKYIHDCTHVLCAQILMDKTPLLTVVDFVQLHRYLYKLHDVMMIEF